MQTKQPIMGLCPIGKFVFSHEDAIRRKVIVQQKLRQWKIRFVDLDGVLPDGLVTDQKQVERVVAHFRASQADCIFMPHCNFGTEGAVGMIARELGLPVLLWGPRDEAPLPDGTRLRDTLCGLFASSKVLHKLCIPFTYIENSSPDDPIFKTGLDRFLRASNTAGAFRQSMRIGMLGQRIDFFWSTIVNESELLERFRVEVLPLDLPSFIVRATQRAQSDASRYAAETRELSRTMRIEGYSDPATFHRVLAVRDEMLALAAEHGLEGLAVQDFMSLVDAMGTYCFLANGMVAETLAVGEETDIHGVISGIMLNRVMLGEQPSFLTEYTVRHPENDNGVLLWHVGAPPSMCHPDDRIRLGHHWILKSPLAGMPHFRLKDGPITVLRFDGDHGDYRLAVGEGRSVAGPHTLNNYVWMQVDDWPHWERTLMDSPFIHHTAMAYGHYASALMEACKYLPGIEPVRLDRADNP
ncbi:MAG: fucose isomerase [Kiritimatiellae bacterium]|nr:fucose isomerase [Kiritimatiellia bacterium]